MKIEAMQKIRTDFIKIKEAFPGNGRIDNMSRQAYTSGTVINVTNYLSKKYDIPYDSLVNEVLALAQRMMKEIF